MRIHFQWLCQAALSVFLSSLAGCGGGGHNLTVSFGYSETDAELFTPTRLPPAIGGLEGNAPSCVVTSGTLPPGLSLGADCAITGTPTVVGIYGATITLTASGYDGSVSTTQQFDVPAPTLFDLSAGTPKISLVLGAPVSNVALTTLDFYTPQAGDQVTYNLTTGSAPSGLTLNPADGTLSGTLLAYGVSSFAVSLTIQHGSMSFTTTPVTVNVTGTEPPLQLSYGQCCTLSVGQQVSVTPTSTFVPVNGSTVSFGLGMGLLPPGLTLDQTTGQISGTPGSPSSSEFFVGETIGLPDGGQLTSGTWVNMTITP